MFAVQSVRDSRELPRPFPAATVLLPRHLPTLLPVIGHISMEMEPLGAVLAVFSISLGVTVARTLPALIRFYDEFMRSGLAMSKHRGYGQSACKAYGERQALAQHLHSTMRAATEAYARAALRTHGVHARKRARRIMPCAHNHAIS